MKSHKLHTEALYFPQKLTDTLEEIKNYPLTIVEAPSGFGKTTALNHFFETDYFDTIPFYKRTFLGGSLSSSWKSFCNIISDIDPECSEILLGIGTPDSETITEVEECIQEIECNTETYILLDNFGDMRKEDTKIFLSALSRHGNKNLHIVVSTMQLPGKSRLQISMSSQIHILTVSDFLFTKEDTKDYYKKVGIELTDDEAGMIHTLTGGWIFAIYIQLLYYIKNNRFAKISLDDLIESAFWERLSPEEKNFYMMLSPLRSFSIRKASFITGKSSDFAKAYLKDNPFIHYDEESYSFYFHSLLSRFLKDEFKLQSKDFQNETYIKCGMWAEENDSKIYAMYSYHKAKAYDRIFAMELTSYDIVDIGIEGIDEIITDIIENTPENIKIKHPQNLVAFAFALFFLNKIDKIKEMQKEIYQIAEKSNLSLKEKNAIYGEMELLLSFLKYNKIDEMSAHHRKALELLEGRASLISIKSSWTFGSPSILYLFHRESGQLDEINRQMDNCLPYYYKLTGGHGMGAELMLHAETEFVRGNFETAEIYCYRAIFEATGKKQGSIYNCGLFLLARLAVLKNDFSNLTAVLEKLPETGTTKYTEDLCRYTPDLICGYLFSMLKSPERVPKWLIEGDISENRLTLMVIPFAQMIHTKLLLESHKFEKVLAYCMHAEKTATIFSNLLPRIYYRIYSSASYYSLGKEKEAVRMLEEALNMAIPDEILMPFAENISWLKPVFDLLPPKDEYGKILSLGAQFEKSLNALNSRESVLSPREYEVAELVKMGLTNKQIASKLYVSLSTVKMIISNIFIKTGIHSRAQLSDFDLKK